MEFLNSHTLSLLGKSILLLAGARIWLSSLARSPRHSEQQVKLPFSYPDDFDALIESEIEQRTDNFQVEGARAWTRSKSCGGQSRDFFEIRESARNTVNFYLGDVAGKGVPATLYQVSCVSLLRQASSISVEPTGVVSEVNRTLTEREMDGRHATLVYGTLDLSSGRLRLLSAGHPQPIRLSRDGSVEVLDGTVCLPLGAVAEHKYVHTEYHLDPGDTLLLYSDGITATRNRKRETFGARSLLRSLPQHDVSSPKALVDRIFEEVSDFGSTHNQEQTVMAVTYTGLTSEFDTNKLTPCSQSIPC